MKNKLLALLLTLFLLTGCNAFNHENENKPEDNAPINGDTNNDGPTTPEDNKPGGETNPDDSGNTDNPGEEGQGGEEQSDEPKDIHTILHCWDWSISNIRDNLESIKNAGFDMIQLSPLQPQQSPQDGSWPDQWWKLYQPRGFKVAENNENKLGNKQELIALCSEAEEQGIDVIVDIVANHLSSDGSGHLAGDVRDYEPTIYNNNLIHQGYGSIDDDVIKGNMGGLCDLMTEDSRVQERVKSLLKEYIDCGIDGFRFDAAKHIETEFDVDEYKSDFWKNTLDVANTYYKNQYSKDLFSYGEVLGETGPGRQYSYYTCRMDITDSEQGDNVLKLARGQTSYFSRNYNTNCQPEQLVLWGESHDTFANDWGESKDDDLETIQKAYFIQSSRKDASVLYFARPNDRSTKLGQIGDESYKNTEVKAINIFRLLFNGKDESLRTSNGCFVNVRGGQGAAIVRVTGSNTEVNARGLKDGTYKDLISNTNYTVTDSKVNIGNKDYLVLVDAEMDTDISAPEISLDYQKFYSNSQTVTVNVTGAEETKYTINDGQEQVLTGSTITLPSSLPNGKVTLKVTASNKNGVSNKTATMIKTTALLNKSLIIINVDPNYTYYGWVWKDNVDGFWVPFTNEDNMIGLDMGQNNMFIVVKFNKDTTNPDWNNKINQTNNISFTKRVYDYSEFTIQ